MGKGIKKKIFLQKIVHDCTFSEGSVTLTYLFVRDKFDWTIGDYNLYAATSTVMQIFGNIIGIYILNRWFGVSEIVLAILGYASAMSEYIIVAFAMVPWQLYLGKLKS